MKKTLSYVIIAGLLGAAHAHAQNFVSNVSKRGTSAATFLSISQGARATAMGSAFVAIADDQSALYWNPAGLANLEGTGILFDHAKWVADIQYNFLAASYSLGDVGTLGLSVTTASSGDMRVTTIDEPQGTGEIFGANDAAVSLAYAIRLTSDFAIGFNPKFVHQSIWKMSASAVALDLGVQYQTPFKGILLGMSITNFGSKMKLSGNNTLVLYDLDPSSGGNNERTPANLSTEAWALPLNFRVGIAYRPELSASHKLVLAVDAAHPSDNYESVNIGGEYTFQNFFAVRGGYKALFLAATEESFTLGAGFKQNLLGNVAITLDYAYSDFGRLQEMQKFSFSINF